jgi:hypothetical protein
MTMVGYKLGKVSLKKDEFGKLASLFTFTKNYF